MLVVMSLASTSDTAKPTTARNTCVVLVAAARLPSSSASENPHVGDARKPTTVRMSCVMLVAAARMPSRSAREKPHVGDADVSKPRAENESLNLRDGSQIQWRSRRSFP